MFDDEEFLKKEEEKDGFGFGTVCTVILAIFLIFGTVMFFDYYISRNNFLDHVELVNSEPVYANVSLSYDKSLSGIANGVAIYSEEYKTKLTYENLKRTYEGEDVYLACEDMSQVPVLLLTVRNIDNGKEYTFISIFEEYEDYYDVFWEHIK